MFPADMGQVDEARVNLNEVTNDLARGLACRASQNRTDAHYHSWDHKDNLLTYNDITKYYYLGRRQFPLPHVKLNTAQAVTLRLLQTGTYPTPYFVNKIHPESEIRKEWDAFDGINKIGHMLASCPRRKMTSLAGDDLQLFLSRSTTGCPEGPQWRHKARPNCADVDAARLGLKRPDFRTHNKVL